MAAVAAWGIKAVAIGVAGGLEKSPFEGPLFRIGLLALVVAFAAAGVAAAGLLARRRGAGEAPSGDGRRLLVQVAGGVAGVVVGMIGFLLVESGVGALAPDSAGWVKEVVGLWVGSLLTAAALLVWFRRSHTGPPSRRA